MYCENYLTLTTSIDHIIKLGKYLTNTKNSSHIFKEHLVQSDALFIYTHRSKTSQGVGSACIRPETDCFILRSINKNASVFIAECIALNHAPDSAPKYRNQKISIYTDS